MRPWVSKYGPNGNCSQASLKVVLRSSRSFLCLSTLASLLLSGLCLVGSDQTSPSKLQIHRWTEQLSSKDWILQAEALQGLGTWKVEASIPLITEVFKSGESDWVRGRAMITLGEIQGDQISEHAMQASKDRSPILRKAALETFELVGGDASTVVVQKLLDDPDDGVQAKAAALFASRVPEKAWPIVDKLTSDSSKQITFDHMRALAFVSSEISLQRLESIFLKAEAESRLRRDIVSALSVASDKAIPLIARVTAHYKPAKREFRLGQELLLTRRKALVGEAFQRMLADSDTALFVNLAPLVSAVQPTVQMGDLLSAAWMLHEGLSGDAVRAGMTALSKIDPTRYESFFTHFLEDEDPLTRALAVRCRSLSSIEDLFEVLREHVRDQDSRVIQASLESLQRVPVSARPTEGLLTYLLESLKTEDQPVLHAAIELLGRRGQKEEFESALIALKPYLSDGESATRTVAANALTTLGRGARTEVVAAQGFVAGWQIVGPFLNDRQNVGFETVYAPEENSGLDKFQTEYRWDFGGGKSNNKEIELTWTDAYFEDHSGDIHVAVQMPVPIKFAVAYAKAEIISDSDRTVRAILARDRRMTQKLWLNEEVVAEKIDEVNEPSHHTVKLELRKGINSFLKTSTYEGPWRLSLRLLDEKDQVAATGLRQVLPESQKTKGE